jgi:Domain of unknown function DUF29
VYRCLEGGRGVSDDGTDCDQWTRRQTALLGGRRWDQLDVEYVIEEIRSWEDEQAHAIESHLCDLLLHLLKWGYQPVRRTPRWRRRVFNARIGIDRRLRRSPSLRRELPELMLPVQTASQHPYS